MINFTSDMSVVNVSSPFQESIEDQLEIPVYIGLYIAVINTVIFMTGTICNVLVIFVMVIYKNTNSSMGPYLVNLGVADLCVLFLCQPIAMMEFFSKERWFLGSAVCKIVPVLESTAQHASSLTVLAITFERMGAVCSPLAAFTKKKRRSKFIVPLIWIISISLASPFAGIADTMEVQFMNGSYGIICHAPLDSLWKNYFVIGGIALFCLLIIVMALMNVQIIRKLRASTTLRRSSTSCSIQSHPGTTQEISLLNKPRNNSLSIRRMTFDGASYASERSHCAQIKRVVFIVVYLFISYMPMRVFILWQMYTHKHPSDIGVESYLNVIWVLRLLIYLHSASNPFIYSFMSAKFMQSFNRLANCYKRRRAINSLLLSQLNMALPGCRTRPNNASRI